MRARVEEVRATLSQHDRERRSEVQDIIDFLKAERTAHQQRSDTLSQQMTVQSHLGNSILTVAQEALRGISDVRNLVVLVLLAVMNIKSLAMSIQQPLDPTKELPAQIEDPLGRLLEIPPSWIESIQWPVSWPSSFFSFTTDIRARCCSACWKVVSKAERAMP